MSSNLKAKTTDWLISRMEKLDSDVSEMLLEMAEILTELRSRGVQHPLMKEGVLRWHKQIADGDLAPMAAFAFGGVGTIVRKMVGLPADKQEEFAKGGKVVIAEHDAKGEIVSVEKPVLQLTTRQLDMAFGDGRVVSFAAQKKVLAARSKEPPKRTRSGVAVNIRADLKTGEIICGQMRFHPNELAVALRELGYEPLRRRRRA